MKTIDWIKSTIKNKQEYLKSQFADIERAQRNIQNSEKEILSLEEDLKKFE